MFGLSLEHLLILLAAGLFILGPERLPEAAAWLGRVIRQVREFAAGAQQQIRTEVGLELDEIRKPLQDLQTLRDLHPKRALSRYLLDDTDPASRPQNRRQAPSSPAEPAPVPLDPDAT